MGVKTTHGPKTSTIFDDKLKELEEAGLLKSIEDAVRKLTFKVEKRDVAEALRKSEWACVLALGCKHSLDEETYLSIGDSIAKILYYERGKVVRYAIPPRLVHALKHFDDTGEWNIKPGVYHFLVPSGCQRLTKNQDKSTKEKTEKRWEKFAQKLKMSKANGKGLNKHRSRPITSRQVTILGKLK